MQNDAQQHPKSLVGTSGGSGGMSTSSSIRVDGMDQQSLLRPSNVNAITTRAPNEELLGSDKASSTCVGGGAVAGMFIPLHFKPSIRVIDPF